MLRRVGLQKQDPHDITFRGRYSGGNLKSCKVSFVQFLSIIPKDLRAVEAKFHAFLTSVIYRGVNHFIIVEKASPCIRW
jgi:hypothetical protein